jgi:hypothetical protein
MCAIETTRAHPKLQAQELGQMEQGHTEIIASLKMHMGITVAVIVYPRLHFKDYIPFIAFPGNCHNPPDGQDLLLFLCNESSAHGLQTLCHSLRSVLPASEQELI